MHHTTSEKAALTLALMLVQMGRCAFAALKHAEAPRGRICSYHGHGSCRVVMIQYFLQIITRIIFEIFLYALEEQLSFQMPDAHAFPTPRVVTMNIGKMCRTNYFTRNILRNHARCVYRPHYRYIARGLSGGCCLGAALCKLSWAERFSVSWAPAAVFMRLFRNCNPCFKLAKTFVKPFGKPCLIKYIGL